MNVFMQETIDSFSGDYQFLSNFYPSPIKISNRTYPTAEHAYQAFKAKDYHRRNWIADSHTPGEAKRRGRRIDIRDDWEEVKYVVMKGIVGKKFNQNPELAELLISTGDATLIEGNHWGDTYWGVCKGKGKNNLGKILMIVRDQLKDIPWD